MSKQLILASGSPRRHEILTNLGVQFTSLSPDIDENIIDNERPTDYVSRLAREKCKSVFARSAQQVVVLGSDTSILIDQKILTKPSCEDHSVEMLMSLSGKWHQVLTAVAVMDNQTMEQILVSSDVEFCQLNEAMCRTYWRTGEPADKAGSYAIQGIGSRFVRQIQGSYTAIVGLPAMQTAQLLERFAVDTWVFTK